MDCLEPFRPLQIQVAAMLRRVWGRPVDRVSLSKTPTLGTVPCLPLNTSATAQSCIESYAHTNLNMHQTHTRFLQDVGAKLIREAIFFSASGDPPLATVCILLLILPARSVLPIDSQIKSLELDMAATPTMLRRRLNACGSGIYRLYPEILTQVAFTFPVTNSSRQPMYPTVGARPSSLSHASGNTSIFTTRRKRLCSLSGPGQLPFPSP